MDMYVCFCEYTCVIMFLNSEMYIYVYNSMYAYVNINNTLTIYIYQQYMSLPCIIAYMGGLLESPLDVTIIRDGREGGSVY